MMNSMVKEYGSLFCIQYLIYNQVLILLINTESISICTLCYHSMVCIKNSSYFLGIKPLLKRISPNSVAIDINLVPVLEVGV